MYKRQNAAYAKNAELRDSLIDRTCLLLKLKYPRQYKKIESRDALRADVAGVIDQFLAAVESRQDLHLNQDLNTTDTDSDAVPEANGFFLLFTNFLRVQFTLNRLIQHQLEGERRELAPLFNVLILFIALHFERDPLHRFWDLDETIGDYALAFLGLIAEAEAENP